MTRKRPTRARQNPEKLDRPAPQPRVATVGPPVERPTPVVPARRPAKFFNWTTGLLVAVVLVASLRYLVIFLLARWRSETGSWPTPAEIGLSTAAGLTATALLIVAGVFSALARRAADSKARRKPRLWLLAALIMGGLFLAWRTLEYRDLYRKGFGRHAAATSPHNHPDIYYVQAVRLRLLDLLHQLEDRRTHHPDQFTESDALQLELVERLRTSMVIWTEQQVGHWLDDLARRRELMEIVAFQIHPLAKSRSSVQSALQREQQNIARKRQWFALLRDYCEQKSQWQRQQRATNAATDSVETGGNVDHRTPAASQGVEVELRHQSLEELDAEMRQKLQSLGLDDWAFARSVMTDTIEGPMTGERLNQIVAQLDAMDARELFLNEMVLPVLERGRAESLNERYRYLQLPVCFPHARQWTDGYIAMTGLHALLVMCVTLFSLLVLVSPWRDGYPARWSVVQWSWVSAALIGVPLLLLFYIV